MTPSGSPTEVVANVEELITNPPAIHGTVTHSLVPAALRWIGSRPRPLRTLETGCGISTVIFAARGDEHTCVTPYDSEPQRVREYCEQAGIDVSRVRFAIDFSENALPALRDPLDLILIDGSHAFPHVFIDYFYATRRLVPGGTVVIDDVHLWTGKVLRDFLLGEPEWRQLEEWDGRTAAFTKLREPANRDWFEQRYVERRSRPNLTRYRMAISMLRQGNLIGLVAYVRHVAGR